MPSVGPTFFSLPVGDHPEGDGLTRFQTAFAGASSADISSFANGSGTLTNATVFDGYLQATVGGATNRSLSYGTDTDLGRPSNTDFTMEVLFTTEEIFAADGVEAILGGTYISSGSGGNTSLYVNGGTSYLVVDSQLNGYVIDTGSVNFITQGGQHHYALCIDSAGSANIYVDGVRKLGPLSVGNLAHSNGTFTLGGTGAGTGAYILRVQGVRIRRAVMYTGASFTPPATPAAWGPP